MVLDPPTMLVFIAIGALIVGVIGLVYKLLKGRIKLENRIATMEKAADELNKRVDRMEERFRKDIDRLTDTIISSLREVQKGGGSS